jgi:hypothetical protein
VAVASAQRSTNGCIPAALGRRSPTLSRSHCARVGNRSTAWRLRPHGSQNIPTPGRMPQNVHTRASASMAKILPGYPRHTSARARIRYCARSSSGPSHENKNHQLTAETLPRPRAYGPTQQKRTNNRSATRPDPLPPAHRHDVGRTQPPDRTALDDRRYRKEAEATVAGSQRRLPLSRELDTPAGYPSVPARTRGRGLRSSSLRRTEERPLLGEAGRPRPSRGRP